MIDLSSTSRRTARAGRHLAAPVVQVATLGRPDGNAANDALARFWRYPANSVKETGGWFLVGLAVARQEGTTGSLTDTARLFAWLGMATADAVKVTASEKATHFTWRPQNAIRRANEDGNPLTDPVFDPAWVSRFGNVGESPEWTSGQSTFAGAGAAVLSGFYGTDEIAFTFNTRNGAADRSYGRFNDASGEAAFSRILQGIRWTEGDLVTLGRSLHAPSRPGRPPSVHPPDAPLHHRRRSASISLPRVTRGRGPDRLPVRTGLAPFRCRR